MDALRRARLGELSKVAEVIDRSRFLNKTIQKQWNSEKINSVRQKLHSSNLKEEDIKRTINGGLLTYLLHCEARIASSVGRGYYTIGPCGEELLGFVGLNFRNYDLAALHYRHLATSITRQLNDNKSVEAIALDRARGFTVSTLDPVTGGRHCSIGGNHSTEFLVTSTLASQAPPGLGRALAIPLSNYLIGSESKFSPNAISYVSLGDGSINNAHFLSALNLAKYSEHNKVKCPLVFGISDNKISISLKGTGYVDKFIEQMQGMFVRVADGRDFLDIFLKSQEVIEYSRKFKRPSIILFSNLPRRFGHAATDRQFAYYSADEIQNQINQDPLSDTISLLIKLGIYSESELKETFQNYQSIIENAFNTADLEPKHKSRADLVATNSAPLYNADVSSPSILSKRFSFEKPVADANASSDSERPEVMRKQMTRVFDEILGESKKVVYIGEDVQHGGYYLVTDGLYKKYPLKVRDFPPDETTLVGAGIGFAQSGLVPIVEIPYAKYLDCASDIFYEAIINNWLSNGKQPNGMIFRLQGFDKGIFGGNYHTHNMLSFPPGLDVICCSNGNDYVRSMRFAIQQAATGRVIMFVDSTDLLNRRHLSEEKKDEFMLTSYPGKTNSPAYTFDEITTYTYSKVNSTAQGLPQIVIITYGNGVPTSALAQVELAEKFNGKYEVVLIDTPFLSNTPKGLVDYFSTHQDKIEYVIFADVCKSTPGMPLANRLIDLQSENKMKNVKNWRVIGASPTYNPLGTYLTFLSVNDILSAAESMQIE